MEEKADKKKQVAKSMVILDVKPARDGSRQDSKIMEEMQRSVRSIVKDGLLWGEGKLVPVGYGIQKLQIAMTIEDAKVSVDTDLVERIEQTFEDLVQSVDVVSFNQAGVAKASNDLVHAYEHVSEMAGKKDVMGLKRATANVVYRDNLLKEIESVVQQETKECLGEWKGKASTS